MLEAFLVNVLAGAEVTFGCFADGPDVNFHAVKIGQEGKKLLPLLTLTTAAMSIFRFLLPALLLASSVGAQNLVDDFSDGDLLNPNWQGDLADFTVENGQLRLMADGAGSSALSLFVTTSATETVTYEFLVNLDFATSAGNFAEVRMNGLNGTEPVTYILQIGGISGNQDALVLTYIYGDLVDIPILSGTPGGVGGDPAIARIRLSRTPQSVWTLEADYTGGTNFVVEATGEDEFGEAVELNTFTFQCLYTATRSDAFYFDDVNIGPTVVDETPPLILNSNFDPTNNQITLFFNEIVEAEAAGNLANYSLNLSSPALTEVTTGGSSVRLTFDGPFSIGERIEVTINQLTDLAGNTGGPYTQSFFITPTILPRPGALIISEFMADPTPEVGLPPVEYLEIHNRTDTVMILDGVQIASGGAPQPLVGGQISPRGYRIIVAVNNVGGFPMGSGNITPVSSFPALSNSGDEIELLYNGQLLQRLEYDLSWYDDPARADGGYSLELTEVEAADPSCKGLWAASRASIGGTPGTVNSVAGLVVDSEGPLLLRGEFTAGGVQLTFSEDLGQSIDLGAFSIAPDLGISGLVALPGTGNYRLNLTNNPVNSTIYTVTVSDELSDCAGNLSATSTSIELGLAEDVAVGDVVINEILFNPVTGGVDFVEVFNCSNKILNVEGWTLSNELAQTGSPRERIENRALLLPGGYLVFTPNVSNILTVYPDQAQAQFLVENRLPSLPDDEGNITLTAPNGDVLDSFNYNEDQHSNLLDDDNGVSLERVNPKSATQNDGNWFSAASRVGFATPTRENSQRRDVAPGAGGNEFFFLDEDTVSPDGDGFQDALLVRYNTPGPGWNAQLRIFDANGRLVKVLRRAELLAGEGTIIWDGTNDDNERARTGIYVILVERFEPNGGTATEKLVAVVVNPK